MSYLHHKIAKFFKSKNEIFRKPLEKIINAMINRCRYMNGESLERHNWGDKPIKLKNIPKNINSPSFEEELLNALDLNENEKSILELLWGDIQLGKRIHSCIVMWISVHILKRPVLYIFRNLEIDQTQLQDDIRGTEKYNFNIQFIKSVFDEFHGELQNYFQEINENEHYWKEYKLPELKKINSKDDAILDKLSNKAALSGSNDIYCCLMNPAQLARINQKFSEYIFYNDELVDITVLVDESDLMSPTSSNDRMNRNDKKDSTASEILLAKIYKKVKYTLHITGTAHSLLYNVTTRLSDNIDIQIKISKVHKMVRSDNYYGLFNNSIHFNTKLVKSWWDYQDIEIHKKKTCYDIVEDYNINIKRIIETILERPRVKYNSFLISEEKIRVDQFRLVDKIIKDFPNLFVIIYHEDCLRLYISKQYETEIKHWAKWDAEQSSTHRRLWQVGGIYGSLIDSEKSEYLPNQYGYFKINTKILNIKLIYKLLRILFEHSKIPIQHKTCITITGKYGERGYSFTSDDYQQYLFHLTDQYFVSHSSLNCTDASQRGRLQGIYNDPELKSGNSKLILWTTPELQDIIENFYVKFIKKIENRIMSCDNWEDIKNLVESMIDNGDIKFGKYMKYIDVSKKRKNLKSLKHYDSKYNGYRLISIDDVSEMEIRDWCKEQHFPDYICINEIQEMNKNDFIARFGVFRALVPFKIPKKELDIQDKQKTLAYIQNIFPSCKKCAVYVPTTNNMNRKSGIEQAIFKQEPYNYGRGKSNECTIIDYKDDDFYHITGLSDIKILPSKTNDFIHKNPYFIKRDVILYSVLKREFQTNHTQNDSYENGDEEYIEYNGLPNKYYWKTPDDMLYLYDNDKPEIISLQVTKPLHIANNMEWKPIVTSDITIHPDVVLFSNMCCKKTEQKNLRIGISEIYDKYKTWCKTQNKKCLKIQKKFKEEFEKMNFHIEESKGVDLENHPGKRGYNISIVL